jgi:hypothetical protein
MTPSIKYIKGLFHKLRSHSFCDIYHSHERIGLADLRGAENLEMHRGVIMGII